MHDETETERAAEAVQVGVVKRALDHVARAAIAVSATALLGLVVVQGWQVFTRYVLNDSPSWTEPVTLLLLSTAMSLGAAAGVHENRHFGFFLLAQSLPTWARRTTEAVSAATILALGVVLAYWSALLLLDGWDIKIAGASLPQSINYLPLCVGAFLVALFALYRLGLALRPAPASKEA
ncbi:MAG: TRAP transporter small permease [Pseudoxanthomonas sp.]